MADVDIGYFTRQQARETWEIVKLLRSSGLLRNIAESSPLDDPGIHHIWVQNISGEVIPPYACMQIDGTEVVGGLTHLKVKKPTAIDSQYVFNHDREIPIDGFGMALPWGIVRMLGSGTASPNMLYGATPGAWTIQIQEDDGPFVVYGDDKDEDVFKGRIQRTEPVEPGSFGIIHFQIIDGSSSASASSSSSDDDTACIDREYDAPAEASAIIMQKSSGVVAEVGDVVTVYDKNGSFLFQREAEDIIGKTGFAVLMGAPENSGSMSSSSTDDEWVIIWIDWFTWQQFVVEWIVGADKTITTRYANAKVWDFCQLDPDIYVGEDCEASSSSASALVG